MYNTDAKVKYKEIEVQLVKNLNNGEDSYDINGVRDICHEIFNHELLLVFGVNNIDDPQLAENISKVWNRIKDYKPFLEVLKKCKLHIFLTMSDILDDDIGFVTMFSYSSFHILHKCIVSYLTTTEIPQEHLDSLKECVEKI
jgi:hypothetical protein